MRFFKINSWFTKLNITNFFFKIFKCLSVLNIYEMPFIYPKFDFDSLLSEYIRSLSIFSKNSSLRFYELGTIRAYFETLIDVYDENEDPKSSLMLTMFKCMISYVFECSNDLNNESLSNHQHLSFFFGTMILTFSIKKNSKYKLNGYK